MVDSVPSMSAFLSIQREKHGSKELPDTHLLYVRTSKHMLDVTVASSIRNLRVQADEVQLDSSNPSKARRQRKRDSFTVDIWVPAALLEHALPGLVHSFKGRGRSTKAQQTVCRTKKKVRNSPFPMTVVDESMQAHQCDEAERQGEVLPVTAYIDLTEDD